MNWERKGPPRARLDRGGHPNNFERPFVHSTEDEKARRRRDGAEAKQAAGLVRKDAEWRAQFGRPYPLTDEDKKLIEKHWGGHYVD
jgi:hypothetical protein